jgi:hypothetical protein
MLPEEPTPPSAFEVVVGAGFDSGLWIGGTLTTGGLEVSEHPATSAIENPARVHFTTENFIRIRIAPGDEGIER